jgi:hypothetical protein
MQSLIGIKEKVSFRVSGISLEQVIGTFPANDARSFLEEIMREEGLLAPVQ